MLEKFTVMAIKHNTCMIMTSTWPKYTNTLCNITAATVSLSATTSCTYTNRIHFLDAQASQQVDTIVSEHH